MFVKENVLPFGNDR